MGRMPARAAAMSAWLGGKVRLALEWVTVPMFLVALQLPHAPLCYWLTSTLASTGQHLLLRSPAVRCAAATSALVPHTCASPAWLLPTSARRFTGPYATLAEPLRAPQSAAFSVWSGRATAGIVPLPSPAEIGAAGGHLSRAARPPPLRAVDPASEALAAGTDDITVLFQQVPGYHPRAT